MSGRIPADDWKNIVENVPIVSVDLLVRYEDGLLLGKRINKPAKGCWFMPGGRVEKAEPRSEAVKRIGKKELGLDVKITESLGTFEHFYQDSDVSGVETQFFV